mgnify:CR=1 FL=1
MTDRLSLMGRPLCSALQFLLLAAMAPSLAAEPVRVLSAGAFKPVVLDLAPAFERSAARPLRVDNDTAGAILKRMRAGEQWDLVIAPPATLNTLASEGRIDSASIKPLSRVAIGVAVRRGSAKPDIGTVEQFRSAVLNARNPAFIDPKAGGSSGIYLDGLFQRMGIAEAIRPKAILVPGGLVAERLVSGEADLAIHQISEILPVAGAELVGPLPDSIQNYTVYAAAIVRGSALAASGLQLIDLLGSEQAASVIRGRGMEPLK